MNARGSIVRTALGTVVLVGVLLSGCSSDSEVSKDDCTIVDPTSPGVTELTIVAKDMAFSESCVQVQPGTLTITFENEDGKVPHNLRVKGDGMNEATGLEAGPFTEDLKLELSNPGDYPFSCDPHANMKGVIVVAKADAGAPTVPDQ